jgi:antiviral helicase SLH1
MQSGLFFFDSSFRPVPLEQHFLGVKGKNQSPAQKKNMDETVFEKACDEIRST